MKRTLFRWLALAAVGLALVAPATARADFATGDLFASFSELSDTNNVAHYSSTGTYIDSLTIPSSSANWSTRGLAVGPDGLLYVVQDRFLSGFAVLAFDSKGGLQQTYTYGGTGDYIGGNISYGKIAFDASGHFFVGAGGGLVEFTTGSPNSGSLFFPQTSNGIFAVKALPNGDQLAASAYDIYELNKAGQVVRDLTQAGSGPNALRFVDLRGLAYDPSTGVLYATMLGQTGSFFQILKIDYATGNLLATTTFTYADDLFLRSDGDLLVGSRTQVPAIFDPNLNEIGPISSIPGPRIFVTQAVKAVPEPASLALLGVGAVGALAGLRRRRSR
jgi:hypothetical protein